MGVANQHIRIELDDKIREGSLLWILVDLSIGSWLIHMLDLGTSCWIHVVDPLVGFWLIQMDPCLGSWWIHILGPSGGS